MVYSKPAIAHDFAIKMDKDIEIIVPLHKTGESLNAGESVPGNDKEENVVPADDLLRERESVTDDEDLSSESSEGTNKKVTSKRAQEGQVK
jgi:hypothetical protein